MAEAAGKPVTSPGHPAVSAAAALREAPGQAPAAAEPCRAAAKRRRAKKPQDAPRRPKSAYMFYLAEFREQYKVRRARGFG